MKQGNCWKLVEACFSTDLNLTIVCGANVIEINSYIHDCTKIYGYNAFVDSNCKKSVFSSVSRFQAELNFSELFNMFINL